MFIYNLALSVTGSLSLNVLQELHSLNKWRKKNTEEEHNNIEEWTMMDFGSISRVDENMVRTILKGYWIELIKQKGPEFLSVQIQSIMQRTGLTSSQWFPYIHSQMYMTRKDFDQNKRLYRRVIRVFPFRIWHKVCFHSMPNSCRQNTFHSCRTIVSLHC